MKAIEKMNPSLLSRLVELDADQIDAWMERAAIMEYDGQLPREEAEWLAFEILMKPYAKPFPFRSNEK